VVRAAVGPVLLAGIVAVVIYGLSERLLPGVVRLSPLPAAGDRLAWPLTYWNAMGALAGMGLVLAAGLAAARERGRAWRRAAAACAPVLGLGCYLTFSRGALGATAAGFAILLALAPTARQLRAAAVVVGAAALAALATVALPAVDAAGGSPGQGAGMLAVLAALAAVAAALAASGERGGGEPAARREAGGGREPADPPLPRLRAAALAALVLVVAVTAVAVSRAERRGGTATRAATPSRLVSAQSNRYAYWRVAIRTFAAHPLVGVGSGGFRVEWLRERPFAESVRDAHSLYLETAAELGVVGLAALALGVGGGSAVCARAVRREGPRAAPAVAAVALWALHAGIDWDWEMPALSLVTLLLLARLAPPAVA
jgi:O-antigen ligase